MRRPFTITMLLMSCLWLGSFPKLGGDVSAATIPQPNTLSAAEKKGGWQLLFDGHSTHGWRNYGKKTLNPQWQVEDGALTLKGPGGGDIVTDREFKDFE